MTLLDKRGVLLHKKLIGQNSNQVVIERLKGLDESTWESLVFREHSNDIPTEESSRTSVDVNYRAKLQDLRETINAALLPEVMSLWGFADLESSVMTPSRFEAGSSLEAHKDTSFSDTRRIMTVVYYPNDNFSGGEIAWPDLNITYSPKAGDVIAFFSEHRHAVSRITKGTRYNCVYFLKNPILGHS